VHRQAHSTGSERESEEVGNRFALGITRLEARAFTYRLFADY
jgi:hypothetical protein